MIVKSVNQYSHERMVSQLYSLAGPQANLPTILMTILNNDSELIKRKLSGKERFSKKDLANISARFHNQVLQLSLTA